MHLCLKGATYLCIVSVLYIFGTILELFSGNHLLLQAFQFGHSYN